MSETHPRNPSATDAGPPSQGSFEDAIRRLNEIVQKLEKGDLPLEDSLRLFEEGIRLSRASQEKLDSAQKQVEQLLGVDEQGRAKTRPFETTAED
jgi:exodeoxyribonuclease VII small subunit